MNKTKKIILFKITPTVLLIFGAMTTCIAYKADIDRNIRSAKMKRLDHSAFENKDTKAMQSLIKCYADVGETPNYSLLLKKSIHSSFFEGAKLSIENGANVNAVDDGGWTPLHFVANSRIKDTETDRMERLKIAKMLIEHNADVNAKTDTGELTPLHFAAGSGQMEMVQLLVDNHANLSEKDASGCLPIDLALKNGYIEIVDLLTKIMEKKTPVEITGHLSMPETNNDAGREYE